MLHLPELSRLLEVLSGPPSPHLILLTILFIVTWYTSLKGGFVSDDIEGVAQFSDRFIPEQKLPTGQVIPEEKVDFYQFEDKRVLRFSPKKVGEKDGNNLYRCGNRQLNPYLGFPACFMRWSRTNIGAKFVSLGKNKNGIEVFGYIQDTLRHHLFSLAIHLANVILCYFFLTRLFGSTLGFMASALFCVYPLGCQTVAWISGINYSFSLLGALATFNIAQTVHNPYIFIPVAILTSFLSTLTLLTGIWNWVILLILGRPELALISFLAGVFSFWNQGKEVIMIRRKAFKDQHLGQSTFFYVRKLIVMIKTLWYYVVMIPLPKRLGLFHTWGYFYDEPMERTDKMFWKGFLSLIAIIAGIILCPFPIKFGLIWIMVYLLIFSNFITAQQFVADRYAFIPCLGWCVILAYLLQSQPILFTFLLGFYAMRTIMHIPTFRNDTMFYQSNIWNFPDSEVALGNLGVTYMHSGLTGMAIDTWILATRVNPKYDVPWYNLYSAFRANGVFSQAKAYLDECLKSKVIHFPDLWGQELKQVEYAILVNSPLVEHIKQIDVRIKEVDYDSYRSV